MDGHLEVLDSIEEVRQKAAEDSSNYSIDYVIRLCAAHVAKQAGFRSRSEWTDALKKQPDSKYSQRLANGNFHI